MYPAQFFSLFPPFPREDKAFIAMSFGDAFVPRWNNVIEPAVRRVRFNNTRLIPHRVDMRVVSDSILSEILDGISRCRVFIADISPIAEIDGGPVRNANVLYEVGLAHAVRLPEEVLLFRSDDRDLMFDVANIRVNRYDPDGSPKVAQEQVADAIVVALREVDLRQHLAVRQAASSLDYPSLMVLAEAQRDNGIRHPPLRTMGEALGAISRANAIGSLLDLGAIRASYVRVTPEMLEREDHSAGEDPLRYHTTPFGRAVLQYVGQQMGFESDDIRKHFEPGPRTGEPST